MRRSVLIAALGVCLSGVTGVSAQTSSTSQEVKTFEVLSVDGNKVVVRGAQGTQEITVPSDFRLTVDGKPVTVQELKPGMKGTARITTTTTTTPVTVTEVRNGEIVQRSGGSIIVRGDKGIQMFTEGDVEKRGVKIIRDGKPVAFSDLNAGDRLSATIITEKPPRVMTQRQVEAALSSPASAGAGAAAPASRPASSSAAAPAPASTAGSAPARTLPKTASVWPMVGLGGAGALVAGLMMTIARRRRI
jgi:hypothetical protein